MLEVPRFQTTPSVGAYFTALFADLAVGDLSAPLAFEFVLALLAAGHWAAHGFPRLALLDPRRYTTPIEE